MSPEDEAKLKAQADKIAVKLEAECRLHDMRLNPASKSCQAILAGLATGKVLVCVRVEDKVMTKLYNPDEPWEPCRAVIEKNIQ